MKAAAGTSLLIIERRFYSKNHFIHFRNDLQRLLLAALALQLRKSLDSEIIADSRNLPNVVTVDATMLAVLIGVVVLHVTEILLLIISTSVNAWRTFRESSYDLWYNCKITNGGYHCEGTNDADWLQAVQALMVLATLFCFISFIIFLCQLFTLNKGGRFFFTAVFHVFSSLFVMSGAIIYTVMSPDWRGEDDSYGYAFVLAWLAFPLTLLSGFIYIVLRKKE